MPKQIRNFIALKKGQKYHLKKGVVEIDGKRINLHQVDIGFSMLKSKEKARKLKKK